LNDQSASPFVLRATDHVARHIQESKDRGKKPDISQLIWYEIGSYSDRNSLFGKVHAELVRRGILKRRTIAQKKKSSHDAARCTN
jgi:hypothetical protein